MAAISEDIAVDQVLAVLKEAFEGPSQNGSYFTDPESGLLGTLMGMDAAAASRVWGGTTIAAHAHHVQFGFAASAAWISGDHSPRDWQESWNVSTIDEVAWKRLKEQLRTRYEELRKAVATHAFDDSKAFGGAIAAVAHAAYHLGAVRQKVAASRKG